MQTKTKNDIFNVIIYGIFISAIYGLTLIASSYFGISAGLIFIVGLAMIGYSVFNFKYLEVYKEVKQ